MRKSQFYRALPLLVLLGGFALRLYRLGAESLWYDETVSLLLARSDLPELTRHTAGDIHPPLYYYLLHSWGGLAGWSEFSSAFLSLVFGVLLIAVVYRVTEEWLTDLAQAVPSASQRYASPGAVAFIAASLVAVSPYNVWYSQEVRMYTLGAVLGLASVYFFWELVNSPNVRARDLVGYVLATALGIYTLYYFIFVLVFQYLLVAARLIGRRQGKMRRLATFAGSQLAVGLLYLPWAATAFRQATDPPVPPWRSSTPLPNMLGESFSALVLGQTVDPVQVAPFLLLVLVLIVLVFIPFRSWDRRVAPGSALALFLISYTFVPLLAIYALSFWKPLYHVRYIFTYSPAFYILLGLAICAAASSVAREKVRVRALLIGAAVSAYALISAYSLGNFWFNPQYADDDLRGAVQYLAESWRPGDAIVVNAGYAYPALSYYYPAPLAERVRLVDYYPAADDARTAPVVLMTGSIDGGPRLGWGDPRSDFYPTTEGETTAALDRVFRSHPRVWLLRIYDTVTDPNAIIRKYFSDHSRLIDDQDFTGESNARVQGYLTETPQALPPGSTTLNAHLSDQVSLLGFDSTASQMNAGENLDVTLYWQVSAPIGVNYQLSLQALDAGGKVIAQHDETPLGDALPTSRWRPGEIYPEPVRLQLPRELAPGDYAIIVKLYNLNNGQVLGAPVRLQALGVAP